MDAEVLFINFQQYSHWVYVSVVEGYIANSKPEKVEEEKKGSWTVHY